MSRATDGPGSDRGVGPGSDTSVSAVSTESEGKLGREEAYEVLSNTRRRHVIHYLLQRDETVSLRDLSRQVAAWENGIEPHEVTSKQRKRVYTALHQSHLPKLDEASVVEYDTDRGVIAPTDRVAELRVYMEVVPENEIPWSVYYTGCGLVMGGATLVASLGLFPFDELSGFAWAGLTAILFVLSGLVHVYTSRQHELGSEGPPPELRP